MSGRKGLVVVTALTVSSLMLGSGALSAVAAERGRGQNGEHGSAAQHQPAFGPWVFAPGGRGEDDERRWWQPVRPADQVKRHDDDDDLVTPPVRVTETPRPCLSNERRDDREGRCRVGDHNGEDDDQDDKDEQRGNRGGTGSSGDGDRDD